CFLVTNNRMSMQICPTKMKQPKCAFGKCTKMLASLTSSEEALFRIGHQPQRPASQNYRITQFLRACRQRGQAFAFQLVILRPLEDVKHQYSDGLKNHGKSTVR